LRPRCCLGCWAAAHWRCNPKAFVEQQRSLNPDAVISPGPLVGPLLEAGSLTVGAGLSRVVAVWPAPDRLSRAPAWRETTTDMIDVQVFGEIGLIAARRGPGGRAGVIPFGSVAVPWGAQGGVIVGEVRATVSGTIAMRGPMVPRFPFPPGVDRTALPQLKVATNGFIDTGFACWSDQDNAPLVVTGPPPGTVSIGGYRFLMRDLENAIAEVDAAATLAALPDAMTGHRLAGSAADPTGIRQALAGRGLNPLLINAFRERGLPATGADDGTPAI
jgi:hypothetical protein